MILYEFYDLCPRGGPAPNDSQTEFTDFQKHSAALLVFRSQWQVEGWQGCPLPGCRLARLNFWMDTGEK